MSEKVNPVKVVIRKNGKEPKSNPVLVAVRKRPGFASEIGKVCGVGRSTVREWRRVPAAHVLKVAAHMNIAPHKIRPDLYPAKLMMQPQSAAE